MSQGGRLDLATDEAEGRRPGRRDGARRGQTMGDFEPTDTTSAMRRRDLIGLVILALVAGGMIVVAVILGGGVGD